MNKIFTQLSIFLLLSLNLLAQNPIPNPGFETWTSYTSLCATGSYPSGWMTSDSLLQCYGAPHTAVIEASEKCEALYSIKLSSTVVPYPVPGVATNGVITGPTTVIGGSPDTARSSHLSGCYKYTSANNDSALISAFLYKRNGASRDTIAYIKQLILTSTAGMTSFSFSFTYKNWSIQPDSILIILQSSATLGSAQNGSVLIVDSLNLSGYVGIDERSSAIKNIHIYPQPAQTELYIDVELYRNIALTYEIADITGRKIVSGEMESMKKRIDISSLNRGNYFVALRNEQGTILHTSKLIVSK